MYRISFLRNLEDGISLSEDIWKIIILSVLALIVNIVKSIEETNKEDNEEYNDNIDSTVTVESEEDLDQLEDFKIDNEILTDYADNGNEFIIPESVKKIDEGAFKICTSLKSVVIPNSVTEIGAGAFRGCSSLTNITIPESVMSIGERAFNGCDELIIRAKIGSIAEQYARNNNILFKAI